MRRDQRPDPVGCPGHDIALDEHVADRADAGRVEQLVADRAIDRVVDEHDALDALGHHPRRARARGPGRTARSRRRPCARRGCPAPRRPRRPGVRSRGSVESCTQTPVAHSSRSLVTYTQSPICSRMWTSATSIPRPPSIEIACCHSKPGVQVPGSGWAPTSADVAHDDVLAAADPQQRPVGIDVVARRLERGAPPVERDPTSPLDLERVDKPEPAPGREADGGVVRRRVDERLEGARSRRCPPSRRSSRACRRRDRDVAACGSTVGGGGAVGRMVGATGLGGGPR